MTTTMDRHAKVKWRTVAEEVASCNSVSRRVTAGAPLELKNENTFAQFARVEWASDGSTK